MTLRSGCPQTVRQKVWKAVLAYNLMRLEMAEVAREEGVAPTGLSFTVGAALFALRVALAGHQQPRNLAQKHLQRMRQRLGELLVPTQRRGVNAPVS